MNSRVRETVTGMEDLMVTTRREETVLESPPGYMRSTLTTPGPCARPNTARRPYSAPAFTFLSLSASLTRPTYMNSSGCKTPRPRDTHNVGFAGFYDWSPGLTIQQCAQKKDTAMVESQSPKAVNGGINGVKGGRVKQWWGPGLRNYTGRMFVKEKGFLTKGEQEIITGIVQNRGDKLEADPVKEGVASHREAWLIGKSCPPSTNRQCVSADISQSARSNEPQAKYNFNSADSCLECDRHLGDAPSPTTPSPPGASDYCVQCLERLRQNRALEPLAPPSTPEEVRRSKFQRPGGGHIVPPITVSDQGAVFVRKVQVNDSIFEPPLHNGQKTVMDVYLPRLPNVGKAFDLSDKDSGVSYGDRSTDLSDDDHVITSKFPVRMCPGLELHQSGMKPTKTLFSPRRFPSPRYQPESVQPKSPTVALSAHIRHSNRLTSLNRSQKSSS